MTHDPMHWQLTLVRLKTRKDGGTYWGSVKDTAANRNHKRFAKMDKQGDSYVGLRGAGVTYDQKPISRAGREALELNAVARDMLKAADVGSQRIVSGKRKRVCK